METTNNTSSTPAPAAEERRFQINLLPFGIIKKFLVFTPKAITYGKKTIENDAIESVHTQIVRTSTNGIRSSTTYTLAINGGVAGGSLRISFADLFYGKKKGKKFDEILNAFGEHAGMSLLTRLLARIQTGGEVTIGPSVWRKDGVVITPSKMFVLKGEPVLVPYERLQMGMDGGSLKLRDRENEKAHAELVMGRVPNSYMVDKLYDYLVAKEGWRDAVK